MINKFITKLLLFIVVSVSIIVIIFFTSIVIVRELADFRLDSNAKILFVGNSHARHTFDDAIIDNSINLGSPAESYFWIYPKVRETILQNPNLETVFIEFSNSQIPKSRNNSIWDDTSLSDKLFTYLPFLKFEDIELLVDRNKEGFMLAISRAFRRNLTRVVSNNYKYQNEIGGYKGLKNSHIDSLIASSDSLTKELSNKYSMKNIEYLEKTISFCELKKIKVFLIRTPEHEFIRNRHNKKLFNRIRETQFGNVDFLDFNDFMLQNDEFRDFGHLNNKGAKIFSAYFNKLIDEGLLRVKNNNSFMETPKKVP